MAHELSKDALSEQAAVLREPAGDVSRRWDALAQGTTQRMVGLTLSIYHWGMTYNDDFLMQACDLGCRLIYGVAPLD